MNWLVRPVKDTRSNEQKLSEIFNFFRLELLREMRQISQQYAGEVWFPDLEFVLWDMMFHDRSRTLRVKEVSSDTLTHLRNFTTLVDGFWSLTEKDLVFLPTAEWYDVYAGYCRRIGRV